MPLPNSKLVQSYHLNLRGTPATAKLGGEGDRSGNLWGSIPLRFPTLESVTVAVFFVNEHAAFVADIRN